MPILGLVKGKIDLIYPTLNNFLDQEDIGTKVIVKAQAQFF